MSKFGIDNYNDNEEEENNDNDNEEEENNDEEVEGGNTVNRGKNAKVWNLIVLPTSLQPSKAELNFLFSTVLFAYRSLTLDWAQGGQMALFIVKLYYRVKTKQPKNLDHKRVLHCSLYSNFLRFLLGIFIRFSLNFSFFFKKEDQDSRILLSASCVNQ